MEDDIAVDKKKLREMSYEAENIGIDDFAMKKREKYGTIIVDTDKRERVEVVNSREQTEV